MNTATLTQAVLKEIFEQVVMDILYGPDKEIKDSGSPPQPIEWDKPLFHQTWADMDVDLVAIALEQKVLEDEGIEIQIITPDQPLSKTPQEFFNKICEDNGIAA